MTPSRALRWCVPPLVVVGVLVGWPLVSIVRQSFTRDTTTLVGGDPWPTTLALSSTWSALGTSLVIALAATLGCVLVGGFLAFVLAFLPFPGSRLLESWLGAVVSFPSFLIPLALGVLFGGVGVVPHLVAGFNGGRLPGWTFMNHLPGVIAAEIVFFTPFVTQPVTEALRRLPRAQLDVAASLGAGAPTILRRIVLPAVAPVLSSAAALTFLLTLNEIGIVLFTGAKGVTTLPMLIYTRAIVTFDMSTASVLAVLQVGLSLGLYAVYRAVDRSV